MIKIILLFAPDEVIMTEAVFIGVIPCFMEVVHVQLSHKRRKVVVLEELREDVFCELVWLLHYEAFPVLVPANYIVELWIL